MAHILLNEDELTIYQLSFPPKLWGVPHDHATWGVIGVYSGSEAFNVYQETSRGLVIVDRQVIRAGEVVILPADMIHDIENPSDAVSGSVHIYGNRHFDVSDRRIWQDPLQSAEPFSPEKSLAYGMALTKQRRLTPLA